MRINRILLVLAVTAVCLVATARCGGDDTSGGRVTDGGISLPDGGTPPPPPPMPPMPPYVNSQPSGERR
jgi:hypothetical protein